ncbi:hypothetical protein ACFQX8_20560 [Klenkia terrae]|uniref:hypothetical protein n=1 Tax=Klenkia terrae TaxID=1052259 RepID=UPI003615A6BC
MTSERAPSLTSPTLRPDSAEPSGLPTTWATAASTTTTTRVVSRPPAVGSAACRLDASCRRVLVMICSSCTSTVRPLDDEVSLPWKHLVHTRRRR